MEHGFGGMFMIRMLIVFVFIYVMFIGIALNIAKVYRIKNGVINILEQQQFRLGVGSDEQRILGTPGGEDGELRKYFKKIPYVVKSDVIADHCDDVSRKESGDESYQHDSSTGVCIVKIGTDDSYYYKVYVYMIINFPLLGLNNKTIPVSGETITFN